MQQEQLELFNGSDYEPCRDSVRLSATPETDALDCELHNPRVLSDRYSEMMEHAQKLERERDEAIFSKNTSAADFLKQIRQITLCKDVAREKLLMAEKERDETRRQFVDFLNKTEDYKRERDDAREALEHIVEYWNRDENETSMSDALWHIIQTAVDVLHATKLDQLKEGGK